MVLSDSKYSDYMQSINNAEENIMYLVVGLCVASKQSAHFILFHLLSGLTSSQNLGHLKIRDFRRNYPQKGVRHEALKVYRGANRFCTAPS